MSTDAGKLLLMAGLSIIRGDRCKEEAVDVRERRGEWVTVCGRHHAALAPEAEQEASDYCPKCLLPLSSLGCYCAPEAEHDD